MTQRNDCSNQEERERSNVVEIQQHNKRREKEQQQTSTMANKATPTVGLDPLKDLFETILVRLEALESKVGVAGPATGGKSYGGGSLSGGSSHGKPPSQRRISTVHGT
jgi:hypothetical protein